MGHVRPLNSARPPFEVHEHILRGFPKCFFPVPWLKRLVAKHSRKPVGGRDNLTVGFPESWR